MDNHECLTVSKDCENTVVLVWEVGIVRESGYIFLKFHMFDYMLKVTSSHIA